uniref:NADH-ubiquinone oxidoreductase chain 5 n=1 Tax=Chirotenon longimanus TaxID=1205658 RepID=A0A0S2MRJ2_9CUCU|nr:NADH deshydrogenase subunit 5 [Chirotenon longimanus]
MLNNFKNFSVLLGLLSLIFFFLSLNFIWGNFMVMMEYSLVNLNSFELEMSIFLDWMSLLFSSFVCLISSMVLYYSEGYMESEKNKNRFCYLVILFIVSMFFLIISPNMISILLGWDGLGLVSYCLVIYYQNIKSFNAGMLTVLTNRIGDVAFLLSIAWMMNLGSWNYIYYLEMMNQSQEMNIVMILIILAAWTKSAQIPFSSWLPAAMAAPTPVSSLVHSSTLVTAGVYLLIRFNSLFSENWKMIMLFFALFTMFMSGLGANYEFDLKKIIALSTLSQLGLMMSILFLGEFKLAFFHLLIHAIFKALLFMCAGNFIHNYMNCQDIRYMGNMSKLMPLTSSYFNVSNLSLCGLPFLSGFYSKDLVVEFMSMNYLNLFVYMVFYFSIGLTVMYSFRLSYYLVYGTLNFLSLNMIKDLEENMLKGMSGLILFVVFSGSCIMWLIFPVPYFICLSLEMKLMTLIMIMMGIFLGYQMSKFALSFNVLSKKFYKSSLFNGTMWNMPIFSTLWVNFYPLKVSDYSMKSLDQGWSEYYGVYSVGVNEKIFTLSSSGFQVKYKIYLMLSLILMFFFFNILI